MGEWVHANPAVLAVGRGPELTGSSEGDTDTGRRPGTHTGPGEGEARWIMAPSAGAFTAQATVVKAPPLGTLQQPTWLAITGHVGANF